MRSRRPAGQERRVHPGRRTQATSPPARSMSRSRARPRRSPTTASLSRSPRRSRRSTARRSGVLWCATARLPTDEPKRSLVFRVFPVRGLGFRKAVRSVRRPGASRVLSCRSNCIGVRRQSSPGASPVVRRPGFRSQFFTKARSSSTRLPGSPIRTWQRRVRRHRLRRRDRRDAQPNRGRHVHDRGARPHRHRHLRAEPDRSRNPANRSSGLGDRHGSWA